MRVALSTGAFRLSLRAPAVALALLLGPLAVASAQDPSPPNDDFSNGQMLSGDPASATGTLVGATLETGEPNAAARTSSVWYFWTAPRNGTVDVSTCGTAAASGLAKAFVYTGRAVGSLTAVAGSIADCSPATGGGVRTFTATAGVPYRIQIKGNTSSSGQFALSVRTRVPEIAPSPSTLDFGAQTVGTTTQPSDLTLTNSGDAPLSVSSLAVSGTHASEFAIDTDTCSAGSIAPESSCVVRVKFTPSATGARTGSLRVSSNTKTGTIDVPLQGQGGQTTPGDPTPTPTPTATATPTPEQPPSEDPKLICARRTKSGKIKVRCVGRFAASLSARVKTELLRKGRVIIRNTGAAGLGGARSLLKIGPRTKAGKYTLRVSLISDDGTLAVVNLKLRVR